MGSNRGMVVEVSFFFRTGTIHYSFLCTGPADRDCVSHHCPRCCCRSLPQVGDFAFCIFLCDKFVLFFSFRHLSPCTFLFPFLFGKLLFIQFCPNLVCLLKKWASCRCRSELHVCSELANSQLAQLTIQPLDIIKLYFFVISVMILSVENNNKLQRRQNLP